MDARAAALNPRPKRGRPKKKATPTKTPAPTTTADDRITAQLVDKLLSTSPGISHAWVANIQVVLKGVVWPKGQPNDAESARKFSEYAAELVREMGSRAPHSGARPLWRNWTRTLGLTAWQEFEFKHDEAHGGGRISPPSLLFELENEDGQNTTPEKKASNPELATIFTTPHAGEKSTGELERTLQQFMAQQGEIFAKLSSRMDRMENGPVPAGLGAENGASGVNDLERRLAGFGAAVESSGAYSAGKGIVGSSAVEAFNQRPGDTSVVGRSKPSAESGNDLSVQYRRLEYLSKNPLECLLALSKNIKEMDDWPFSGTSGKDRVAPWYFAQVYQGGRRGVEYARKWIRDHGLHKHHKAEQMVVLLMSVDEALLYDGVDILNSAAFEVIARRCYALEKVFAKCRTENDWKNSDSKKNKARMYLLDEYDLVAIMAAEVKAPEADQTVKKELEVKAQFEKFLRKAEDAGVGGGDA